MKSKIIVLLALTMAFTLVLGGCGAKKEKTGDDGEESVAALSNPATKHTKEANKAWYDKLDFEDKSEWEKAC